MKTNKEVKILAIASIGGHWKQLLNIVPHTSDLNIVYVSTHPKCDTMIGDNKFYCISDFSRWDLYKIIPTFFKVLKIIRKEKPSLVVTTGAAPGLIGLFAAKLLRVSTFWVDSVANVQHLSLSGRIASKFSTKTYTQWPNLASKKILYHGNIFE